MPAVQIRLEDARTVQARADDGAESQSQGFELSGTRRSMVTLFQQWLNDGWRDERRKITRRRELEVLGRLLYEALLPGDVATFVERYTGRAAGDGGEHLRLELSFRGDRGAP